MQPCKGNMIIVISTAYKHFTYIIRFSCWTVLPLIGYYLLHRFGITKGQDYYMNNK